MTKPRSTVHQIVGQDGKPYTATGCFSPWIGSGNDVFAMPRDGNKAIPLLTGKAYYADLIASVDAAQREVLIIGWQVAWDALLAPGVRLYDLLHRNAKRGVKFYVMPWDDTNPVQTYDDQTRIVFEDINRRLGLKGDKKAIHVLLSPSFASVNNSYFSHHQKCVVVDRKIGYMGGIDLTYGRYDNEKFTLRPDADGRAVLNRYNPCVAWMKPLRESDVVDPDLMSGGADHTRPSTWRAMASAYGGVPFPVSAGPSDDRSPAEKMSDKAANGGWQAPYQDNTPVLNSQKTDADALNLTTLDESMQPRMPWQDVHCRIEGPVVSDMVRNFAVRWNIGGSPKLPLPDKPETYPKPGKARIQFLRSAPAAMRTKEYAAAKEAFSAPPSGRDNGIQQAMIRLIENAAHFVYIESQFFVSGFGKEQTQDELSPVGNYIQNSPKGIGKNAVRMVRGLDDLSSTGLDQTPKNRVCQALIARIQQAIFDATQPHFHVYITLPVHPEGDLMTHAIAAQVYWTMQSIANGIRRALKAKELKDKKEPYDAVLHDPKNVAYKDIPVEACERYVTLLNLRNWDKIGPHYVTEQIYIHSKIMVVDDRFAIVGSANVNDRSLLGERDSEIAVLVIDTDTSQCDIGTGITKPVRTFARDLRTGIWRKLFGISGNVRSASQLKQAIEQPANPASWQAIQKQAKANAAAYEKAFPFVPRNWFKEGTHASVLPTWDSSIDPKPGSKWKHGVLTTPLPSQLEFWQEPQHNPAGVAGLADIKGFITALPIYWAEGENLNFKLPTSILVENKLPSRDVPKVSTPALASIATAAQGET